MLRKGRSLGWCTEEIVSYDHLDEARQTVCGFTGTIPELCEHFGVEESMVSTRRLRYGMSLEQALTSDKKKIKVVYLNGERMVTKAMYESFGFNAKQMNNIKSKNRFTIHEVLEHCGVDLSSIDLKY